METLRDTLYYAEMTVICLLLPLHIEYKLSIEFSFITDTYMKKMQVITCFYPINRNSSFPMINYAIKEK